MPADVPDVAWSTPNLEVFSNAKISNLPSKERVAQALANRAKDNETIGVGSGTTAYLALRAIGERVAKGTLRNVSVIPTSYEISITAAQAGLHTCELLSAAPDWVFDGADEVDPNGDVLKGRGGALLREKLVFRASRQRVIVADETKLVPSLGATFPVPIEVVPNALPIVQLQLHKLGAVDITLRLGSGKDGPTITEAGNFLLDCKFEHIRPTLERDLKLIVGVIDSGLFQGDNPEILVL